MSLFLMAGGGTGGHVIPAIAVARELVKQGHEVVFVGTERGAEGRLVPAAGFRLETIEAGGLKRLGLATKAASLYHLGAETLRLRSLFAQWKPAAVFSMGGFVAGPTVLAALSRSIPVVLMEPNAIPGITNRAIASQVKRALVSFEETAAYFPKGRTEITGLPVREEFFAIPPKPDSAEFTILITGGSQGSQTLNNAARAAWSLFVDSGLPVRIIHQTGTAMFETVAREFAATGLPGEVSAFIADMPTAFREADLVVCRSGAGAVSELAAAGKPSVLIPFPFAADDHQLKNAQAFERAGASMLSLDREWTGQRFFEFVRELYADPGRVEAMGRKARSLARTGAASRAAEILMQLAVDKHSSNRNNK